MLAPPPTHDCTPTMDDEAVLSFCRRGFLKIDAVIDDLTNHRVREWLDERVKGPGGGAFALERQPWFVENVLRNPVLGGILRSLLGSHFGLPTGLSSHLGICPSQAGGWHHDHDCPFGHETNYLYVFYFPQDTPLEIGPTEVLSGSHHLPMLGIRQSYTAAQAGTPLAGPAGTIGVTDFSILHRRHPAVASSGTRHMLKMVFWRTQPPQRDWAYSPDTDLEAFLRTSDYGHPGSQFNDDHVTEVDPTDVFGVRAPSSMGRYAAAKLYWLMGRPIPRMIGGQAWPSHNHYGFESQAAGGGPTLGSECKLDLITLDLS